MALDIREGDYLVNGTKEHPIKSCAEWAWSYGRGARRLMTLTVSTKRQPAMVSGKRGGRTTKLTGLKSTPLDPVNAEIRQRLPVASPYELLQAFVDGGDVFYHLILEDIKA